jgi:hypothetical protein
MQRPIRYWKPSTHLFGRAPKVAGFLLATHRLLGRISSQQRTLLSKEFRKCLVGVAVLRGVGTFGPPSSPPPRSCFNRAIAVVCVRVRRKRNSLSMLPTLFLQLK